MFPLYAHYGTTGGRGADYAYDALGRVLTATKSGQTLAYQYDAAGNRTQMTWPDSFYVQYVYDVLNRMTAVEENGATSGVGLLASYAYDSLGRRSSVARAGGSPTGVGSTGYAYDGASRLYTLAQSMAGSASVTYTFGYNAANQIVSKQVSNSAYIAHPGPITAGYTTNGLNQYTAVTGITASYVAANSAALTYDATGVLQSETTAGATTNFLYDGTDLVGEYSSAGAMTGRYVMGPGVDEPVVWYPGAGTSTRNWLTADNQGSVIGYEDQSGNSRTTYTYGPYGEPIPSSGASAWGGSRYRFTGQIEIPEAQLYYYKARVYDPGMGRFYQTDPVGYQSDVNSYAYVGNDPINGEDPNGLATIIDTPPPVRCITDCGTPVEGVDVVYNPPPKSAPDPPIINITQIGELLGPPTPSIIPDNSNSPAPIPPQSKSPSPAAKPKPTGLCRLGIVAQGSATNLGRVAGGLTVGGLIPNPLSPELLMTGTAFGVTAFGLDMTGVALSASFCPGG